MKHLSISVLLLLVSVCAFGQTGKNAVKRDGYTNQVLIGLTDGDVKYYNTGDLESIDFNSGEVTFKHHAGNDTYKNLISGMRFLKAEPVPPMTEEELSDLYGDLVARMLALAYNPKSSVNDIDRIDYLLETLSRQQAAEAETRGVWSQAKSIVDFGLVLRDANKLHRCTVIGAMSKFGLKSKNDRQRIWRDIMDADVLPFEYRTSCDQFWKSYSMGELDFYAKEIYKAIMDHAVQSAASPTEKLASEMAANGMRHIDLTLAVAPKLIEAGANIVFAFGDDLIQTSKLAYDFFETNGKVVFELVEGNLTAETFIDACNNNLKLLADGLTEVVPDGADLAGILADATAEQVKQLNQEINDAIKMAGHEKLSPSDVAFFVDRMKNVLKIDWKPDFLDEDYVSKDKTYFHITSQPNKTYVFHYYDADDNLLWGGRCSIDPKYMYVQVNVLDPKCDLLRNPKNVGDIVVIPFVEGYQSISLGSSTSGDVKFKLFSLKNETIDDVFAYHDTTVGYSHYYNADYQLSFTEYSEGHHISVSKYFNGSYRECFSGLYTADGSRMGITVSYLPSKVEGEENPFDKIGMFVGDFYVIPYNKTDDGFSLDFPGLPLSFWKPVNIDGVWWTEDALGKFRISDGGWSYYDYVNDGLEDWMTMGLFYVDQSKKMVTYRVTQTARSTQIITLPSSAEFQVELKKNYTAPFTLEEKNGIVYLRFKLFDYEFVLVRDRNVDPNQVVELETVDKTGDPGDRKMKIVWNERSDRFELKGRALKDIEVECEQDFIHIQEPDTYSSSVMINFRADMNPQQKVRTALITVKATRADGTKGVASMTVAQEPGLGPDLIESVLINAKFPSSKTIEEYRSHKNSEIVTQEHDRLYYKDTSSYIDFIGNFDLTNGKSTYTITPTSNGAHFELSKRNSRSAYKVSFDLYEGFNEGKATNFILNYEVYDENNALVGQHVLKASEIPIRQPDYTSSSRSRTWISNADTGIGYTIGENSGSVYYDLGDGGYRKYTYKYIPGNEDEIYLQLYWKGGRDPYGFFEE